VTLTGRTNADLVVFLTRSSSSVFFMPPNSTSVTVPAGSSSATFSIVGNLQTATSETVTITASHGAVIRQTTITVNLSWLINLTASPQALEGGGSASATATINGPGAANGTYNVTFTTTNTSLVATPKPITYTANSTGQTTIFTNPVLTQTPVVVTAHDP